MENTANRLDKALIGVATASGAILFVFFSADILRSAQGFEIAVRVFLSVVAPLPLLLFGAFLFVREGKLDKEREAPRPGPAMAIFAVTFGISLGLARIVELWVVNMSDLWQVPLCINSYVYAFNVYNFITIRNVYLSSVFSSISLGITTHVLFV
jgi:hypothetical protein